MWGTLQDTRICACWSNYGNCSEMEPARPLPSLGILPSGNLIKTFVCPPTLQA